MSEVDHASNWDRLIFALELAVNSKINMELTTSQCKYLLDKLTSLTDRVADLEAERRWIPVSERLPELPDWVTCLTDRNEVFPATYIDGKWFDDVQDKIGRYQHVTHWMPLPPPPEDK